VGQVLAPKRVQLQIAPEFARQPAGSVLAGTAQPVVAHAEGYRGPDQIGGDGPVVGEEAQVFQLPRGVIKNPDDLGPGRRLGVTQFTKISRAASCPFLPVSAPSGVPAEHLTRNTF